MQRVASLLGLAILGLLMLVTAGCGGDDGGTGGQNTSARFVIEWPPQAFSRVLPASAQSIRLTLSDSNGFTATQTVDRPAVGNTSTVTFTNVPIANLTVTATAYPQAGGQGNPLSTGTSPVTTLASQQVTVNLTMASTVDHLVISSPGGVLSMPTNGTLQLSATAKDAANNTVLVGANNITWASAAPGTASVNAATGLVTGVVPGTAVITATESDSNTSQSVTVTVVNAAPTASFTVTPGAGTTTTSFAFDASASSDVEDAAAALQVRWDWNNSGTWTTYSATKTATHSYAAVGTYTVAMQVKDSGGLVATTTRTVTVTAEPIVVSLNPTTTTISVGKTAIFTPTVLNTANTAVTWSVVEAGGGSVNAGVYTAPSAPGTYHVKATSVADPTKSATATVTVQAGDVSVIVN